MFVDGVALAATSEGLHLLSKDHGRNTTVSCSMNLFALWEVRLETCFSIHFSLMNPTNVRELNQEPLHVHSKSNIKLNTSVFLAFMYSTSTLSGYGGGAVG
jgi:hypothetical protein